MNEKRKKRLVFLFWKACWKTDDEDRGHIHDYQWYVSEYEERGELIHTLYKHAIEKFMKWQ